MEDATIDGYHNMNAAYFLGCMAEETPTEITEALALAGAHHEGKSQ